MVKQPQKDADESNDEYASNRMSLNENFGALTS